MLENEIKISICVAYKNASKFFKQTINSIAKQSYSNWELLICDNGSSIEEQNALRKLVEPVSSKTKIFVKADIGTYAARWVCYDNVSGDLVLTCDADDTFMDNVFEFVVDKFMLHTNMDVLQANGVKNFSTNQKLIQPMSILKNERQIDLISYKKLLCNTYYLNSLSCICFKSNLLKGIKCDKNIYLLYNEDGLMVCHIINHANSIYYYDKPLFYYRQSENSMIHVSKYNSIRIIHSCYVNIMKDVYRAKWDFLGTDYTVKVINDICQIYLLVSQNKRAFKLIKTFSYNLFEEAYIRDVVYTSKPIKIIFERKIILILLRNKCFFILFLYIKILSAIIRFRSSDD